MHSNQNLKNNLANQDYWDDSYASFKLEEVKTEDVITRWIRDHIPPTEKGTCFEVGCFPGRYLTRFGRLGYELNGLDLTPRVKDEFPKWLEKLGYKTGSFFQTDFFNFPITQKFDVVCSFGFIEHFKNWELVFEKHLELVKPGGYIIVETPNFKGLFQRFIHFYLDRKNYERHHIPAMNPAKWASICKRNGFVVLNHGYLGEFQFWVDEQPASRWRSKFFHFLIRNSFRLQKLPPHKKLYAPYCGIVAQLPLK